MCVLCAVTTLSVTKLDNNVLFSHTTIRQLLEIICKEGRGMKVMMRIGKKGVTNGDNERNHYPIN
jgi:hypothetical protein